MDKLEQQFRYYVDHQQELVQTYDGRWVVIIDETVAADFDSEIGAYEFATEKYPAGTFLIQQVAAGEANYSQTFHSRVIV